MANTPVDKFKLWIFPTLVFLLGTIIWQDVKEIKSDVKALMAQSNIDKTRIDNLEREFYKTSASLPANDEPAKPEIPVPLSVRFALTEFLPAKNELEEEEIL